jgi:hypothetical protein
MKREEGSVTVELVLLAPVLMMLVLFVVYAGRGAEVLTQIQHAADQGARAASMAHPSRMEAIGRDSAMRDLEQNGAACIDAVINVAFDDESEIHTVLVEVECAVNAKGLNLLGANNRVLHAESLEVIDRWRVD